MTTAVRRLLTTLILLLPLLTRANIPGAVPDSLPPVAVAVDVPAAGPDSVATPAPADSARPLGSYLPAWPCPKTGEMTHDRCASPDWWWTRLRAGTLHLADTSIIYPRFLGFCVNVYNWADRVFNSYDEQYVRGTGKRWKASIVNDNWLDSYAMDFHGKTPIWMLSDPYCTAGPYLQYMAVSVGYAMDLTNIIGNRPLLHKRWDFAFTCARFYAEAFYGKNTGGTYLRRFGKYNGGHLIRKYLPGVSFETYSLTAYYFFNNRRYSQGAVYAFSKLQVRSAGSWIAGISISNHDIDINFSSLSPNMLHYLGSSDYKYRFHYNDFAIVFGYGYNAVLGRGFVFNITAAPSVGFKHCFRDCSGGRRDMWSVNIMGRMGVAYNLGNFYAGARARMDGHWFRGSEYNFFNSIEAVSLVAGVRF